MTAREGLQLVASALLIAVIAWAILATPGLISDQSSTVAAVSSQRAMR